MKCFKIDYNPAQVAMPGLDEWVEIEIFDFNYYMNQFHYGNAFGGDRCVGFRIINFEDLKKGAPALLIYQVRSDEEYRKLLGEVNAKKS